MVEINGDDDLGPGARAVYLVTNLARNARGAGAQLQRRRWYPDQPELARVSSWSASPVRLLMELFLVTELPRLLPRRRIRVLDIGCGSGRMRHVLAEAAYSGSYLGVDVEDRFRAENADSALFHTCFVQGDAADVEVGGPFDLVLSVSALEHIDDDRRVIERARAHLDEEGMQLHLVPSPWSLFAYLWHGYRQYGGAALLRCFDREHTEVRALGGLPSLLVHVVCITLCEVVLRWPMRRRLPTVYQRLVRGAVRLDRLVPICPATYAVLERRRGHEAARSAVAEAGR